jgi:feruloyl esterase
MLPAAALLLLVTLVHCTRASPSFESLCLTFRPAQLIPGATQKTLQYVPAGTNLLFPNNVASCNRGSQVASANMCRIALSVVTSEQSNVTLEAWFPEVWTERFLAVGNGGIDGCRHPERIYQDD